MGLLLFIGIGVIVVLLLIYFKKHAPRYRVDKTAWDPSEREAFRVLKERLETGDITQQEYDEKIKEIENRT